MRKVELVPLSSLVLDQTAYVRHEVDSTQVRRLMDAIAAGDELPPILVDEKSRRIVDGVHRYTATLRSGGESASIRATFETWDSEEAMLLASVAANSRHGVPMERMDQMHCVQLAIAHQIPLDRLAVALAVPFERLESMRKESFATGPSGAVILKPAMKQMFAGRRMTKAQVAVNDKLVGQNATYYLNIAADLLSHKMLDFEDQRVVEAFERLKDAVLAV